MRLIVPPTRTSLVIIVVAALAAVAVAGCSRASVPFCGISLAVLAIAAVFPDVALWIPRLAMAALAR